MRKYRFAVALSGAILAIAILSGGLSLFTILACAVLLTVTSFVTYRETKASRETKARKIITSTTGLPKATDTIEVKEQSKDLYLHSCGHRGPKTFVVSVYGEDTLPFDPSDDICADCVVQEMKKFIIRCARCSLGIWPGQAVAGYDSKNPGLRLEIATEIDKGFVAGCMRWECCPSGAFYYGHWTGEKFKPAFSEKTMAEECLKSGKTILVNLDD